MSHSVKIIVLGTAVVAGVYVLKHLFREKEPPLREPVQLASEDSFPASDAPAWTGTTGPGA